MSKKTKNSRMTTAPAVVPKRKAAENGSPANAEVNESLKVPAPLANMIFEYLKKQPWEDAQPIIAGLLRCEKLKE